MSVVIGKSLAITNRDASPRVRNDSYLEKGMLREVAGYCAVASGDSIGSTYLFGSVPSNARVSQVILACTAITSAAADVGVQETTVNGSAAPSGTATGASCFGSAVSLASALTNTDITQEANVASVSTLAAAEQPLWQALGYTADPCRDFDVVATLTAAATAAGGIFMRIRYVA